MEITKKSLFKIGKDHGSYLVTTILYSSLPLLFLPVLTRFLQPDEYANISLFRFYFAISTSLVGKAVPTIISKYFFDSTKEQIAKIVGNSIFIILLFSLGITICILVLNDFLQGLLDLPVRWLIIMPWASFCFIVFNMALTVMRNRKRPGSFSLHKIGNSFVNISASLFLVVVLLEGWEGRLWGIVSSYFLSAVLAIGYLYKNGYLSISLSKTVRNRVVRLLLPLIPNSIQGIVLSQIGVFFMQYFFTKELLGVYSVGLQVSMAIKLLYTGLAMSWTPLIYNYLSNPETKSKVTIARFYLILLGIILGAVLFVNLFAGLIVNIVSTPAYSGASEFIPWFTTGFLFTAMCIFLQPILIKFEKQKFISIVSTFNMFLIIGLNLFLVQVLGYIGIAIAYTITTFVQFFMFLIMAQKVYPLPWLLSIKSRI